MISGGSCDTEDWSNDAGKNSFAITGKITLQNIEIEKGYFLQ